MVDVPEDVIESMQEVLNFCQHCETDEGRVDLEMAIGEASTLLDLLVQELDPKEHAELVVLVEEGELEDADLPELVCNNCGEPFGSWQDLFYQ